MSAVAFLNQSSLRWEPAVGAVLSVCAEARPDRRIEPHLRRECFGAGAERGEGGGAEELCG